VTINKLTALGAAVVTFAAGAEVAYLWTTRTGGSEVRPTVTAPRPDVASARPGVIPIDPELARRAGITIESAGTSTVAGSVRVPATVQPNAYRQVGVTPLVGGRVTRVFVELGQQVARGAAIAEVYSPDVAEARARYLTMQADTDAGEAKLQRTERLAALGSASQQELEQVRAEHVRHETEVRQAAARLRLLGLADSSPSTMTVTAPQAGVIVQRPATPGMTAEPSTLLATIAELSPVWILADVYERDFGRIVTGAPATVTAEAYPGVEFHGRVSYVSPEVRPETRTSQLRIELPNPDVRLRFGMFVTATIGERSGSTVIVPRAAVQMVGADSVVFVPEDAAGTAFHERRVTVGPADGDRLAILDGLSAGERVVTNGSFVIRAEAERLAVRPEAASSAREGAQTPQTFTVRITTKGFEPGSLTLSPGVPARVTFIRTTDETCATELAMPDFGIKRALPLNQPVVVEFTPTKDAAFQCGMGMLVGKLVVR
jgi:RND family efflux transporter MFP subunit